MEKSIGALWRKTSKKGTKFFSGTIEIAGKKIMIVVFENDKKEQEKHPDFRIFESAPMATTPKKDDFEDEIPWK